ncbi:MAG: efflux RND transporter periplasmic adaptor subunit, partial [Ruminiclostridium sp.]|nr:efflux RND transporter periplasmic adaptor subunit [Ruminiclostridium sp.]
GPVYSTKAVVRGNIAVGVETIGGLDPSQQGGLRVPGNMKGGMDVSQQQYTILEYLVKEGDSVKAGQLVARLDSPGLKTSIATKQEELGIKSQQLADLCQIPVDQVNNINPSSGITIMAPVDGNITDLDATEGKELELGQIIGRVVDNTKFKMDFKIFIAEFEKIKIGQKVILSFPYFDDTSEGIITYINPNATPYKSGDGFAEGYAHNVTIEGTNEGLIQRDMEATVGLKDDKGNYFYFTNKAKVTGFAEDEKIVNTIKAIVTDIHVDNMDYVKKGDPIITMAGNDIQQLVQGKLDEIRNLRNELQELTAQESNMEVTAPMDGIVAGLYRQVGESIGPGEWFGSLYTVSDMSMWSMVDDIDIVNIRQGAPVKVTVDAIPGKTFKGEVNYVSTMAEQIDGKTSKFRIGIKVQGDGDLRPGMQAKAYIDAGSAENVLLVPIEAVFEESGKMQVEVLKSDGTTSIATVTLGLMNDKLAEVKEGLNEGDLAITGSTSDLLPSQHIKSEGGLMPQPTGSAQPTPGPQG